MRKKMFFTEPKVEELSQDNWTGSGSGSGCRDVEDVWPLKPLQHHRNQRPLAELMNSAFS